MNDQPHRSLEVKHKDINHKSDLSMVVPTLIKYSAYVIIFFGFLYFLANFVFLKF